MENLTKKPARGILKQSSSFEQSDSVGPVKPNHGADVKWNEMNILQTLHPPDKDYGHMKIEEPKTPYSYGHADTSTDENAGGDGSEPIQQQQQQLDPELLSRKLRDQDSIEERDENSEEEEEDEELTEEERVRRRDFEMKRKSHYNEFQAVKLARQLLAQEDDEDDEDEGGRSNGKDSTNQDNGDGDLSMTSVGAESNSGDQE